MKRLLIGFILILQAVQSFPQDHPAKPFAIGETIEFRSEILGESRTLNIYLPNGYRRDSAVNYPVIYLLDGSRNEDFIHIVGLVQFFSFPWIKTLPETIVVGIANNDRKHDFTFPSRVQEERQNFPTTGGSAKFIEFLEKEVKPLAEKQYHVEKGGTIIGQSLGGLLATEILLKKPELFDRYLIISPSLWWDRESLLGLSQDVYRTSKTVYIAVGKEGDMMEKPANQLYQLLKSSSPDNTRIFFRFYEDKNHGDALHQAVYDSFEKISK